VSEGGWGDAWLAEVGRAGRAYADRLGRGPYYVSRGAVRAFEVQAGMITATFLHGRQRSQAVSVQVPLLEDDDWAALVHALATELRFAAAITDGELPGEAHEVLADAGVRLVPPRVGIVETCACSEGGGDPCRHIASIHHRIAELLEDDPFALLTMRGRSADSLRAALRAVRTGEDLESAARSPDAVGIGDLEVADPFGARGDLDAVVVHPRRVEDPAWLFDQLGEPPGFSDSGDLQQLIVRAADTAWRIAAGDGSDAADTELLLAELRAQRMSTPNKLATALGWEPDTVADALDALYHEGAVMRMGEGLDAKYRASA
jgi:uncharacterized Zn finger protein